MTDQWQTNRVFLGAGGAHPGVDLICTNSAEQHRILNLPADQSVYALDVSPDLKEIVVGTKTGHLYWLDNETATAHTPDTSAEPRMQGAPILATFPRPMPR